MNTKPPTRPRRWRLQRFLPLHLRRRPNPTIVDLPDAPSADELRGAAKAKDVRVADVMRQVQKMHPDAGLATFDDIAEHRDAALDLADWIDQQ